MSYPAFHCHSQQQPAPVFQWTPIERILCEIFENIGTRFPHTFNFEAIQKCRWMVLQLSEEFYTSHKKKDLISLILGFAYLQKKLHHAWRNASLRRHLCVRINRYTLHLPFGTKRVIGILIGMNILKKHELFNQEHLLHAISRILPTVRLIKNSCHTFIDTTQRFRYLYLEVDIAHGDYLTSQEIVRMKESLKLEIRKSIAQFSPSLFLFPNEEQLFKNLLYLSSELQKPEDLPQIMILFREQKDFFLSHSVLIVRPKLASSLSFQKLSKALPEKVNFSFDRILPMGTLSDQATKEAAVLLFNIDGHPFLRRDHAIDLLRVRQFLSNILEKMFGPFRDFNGGLYQKQSELLNLIREALGDKGKKEKEMIELFFFSLSPPHMQAILPLKMAVSFCTLFLQVTEQPCESQSFLMFKKSMEEGGFATVIKAETPTLNVFLAKKISSILPQKTARVFSQIEFADSHYFSLLCWGISIEEENGIITQIAAYAEKWQQSQKKSNVFRIAISTFPQNLDPHSGIDRLTHILQIALFEGLMRHSKEGTPLYAAAEDVHITNSNTQFLFTLRDTIWSNGDHVSAFDFEWAWKKAVLPTADSPRAELFFVLKNAKKIRYGQKPIKDLGVKAKDAKTLEVHLEYPAPYFLDLLCLPYFLPLYRGKAIERSHVINGPFQITRWEQNNKVILMKNPKYWDQHKIDLDEILIHIIPNPQKMYKKYTQGDIDWAGSPFRHLPIDKIKELKSTKRLKEQPIQKLYWLALNTEHFPLTSPKIRQALSFAMDRKKILNTTGLLNLPTTIVTHHFFSERQFLNSDPKHHELKAKLLFEEGLHDLGITRKTMPRLRLSHSDIPGQIELALAIKKEWEEKLQISVELEGQPWLKFFGSLGTRKHQIGGCLWAIPYKDPVAALNFFRDARYGLNVSQWEDRHFSELLDQIDHTTDLKKRYALCHKAQEILLEQMPVIPIYAEIYKYVKRDRVKHFYIHSTGQIDFRWTEITND